MSDSDIFSKNINSNDPSIQPVPEPNGLSANPELAELVGEGRKYASMDEAVAGIPHAQKHIQTIQDENLQLREKLKENMANAEILKQVEASKGTDGTHQPALDKETIANLVSESLNHIEVNKAKDNNRSLVNDKMVGLYGTSEAAAAAFTAKAKEMNVSSEFLLQTAEQSPDAFYNMMGINGNTNSGGTNLNTDVSPQMINNINGPKLHTYEWYRALRKEIGNDKFHTDKIQKEMHEHSAQMGRAFFD